MAFDDITLTPALTARDGSGIYWESDVLDALRAAGKAREGMEWEEETPILLAFAAEKNLCVYAAPSDTFSLAAALDKVKRLAKEGVICDNLS